MTRMWTMQMPVPVEFGSGCVTQLGKHLGSARHALLVTGRRAMRKAGVTDRLVQIMHTAGCEVEVFDGISAEPNYDEIEAAGEAARRCGAQIIVGCGGGSALDAAKATAVAATHPGPILDYVNAGPRQIGDATLPVLAIAATSGTGSHIGRVAVLSDRSRGIKRALISDYLYPRAAYCDPEVLCSMPPDVTAVSGWDAFAQALEGYLSRLENPLGAACAQDAMRVIYRALPGAVRQGGNLELRQQMAWGDTAGGISLATNAVITPHAIAMVLGGRYGITHGRAIASVTVACLENLRPFAAPKLAQVGRMLGLPAGSEESLADQAILEIERFIADLGLAIPLTDYRVPESEYVAIAEEARAFFAMRIDADPAAPDVAAIVRIMQRSVERWGQWRA